MCSRARAAPAAARHRLARPLALGKSANSLAVPGIEHGFETESLRWLSASRIYSRRPGWCAAQEAKRTEDCWARSAGPVGGDLVVHVDQASGASSASNRSTAAGAPHDCLEIHYPAGDKLYLPSKTSSF